MKWIRRILVAGLILLILLIGGVIIALRSGADRADLAQDIGTGGIVVVKNFSVDLYAAKTASTAIVFDAGIDSSGKAIDRLLEGIKVQRESVSDLFITHGHPDHFASAPLLTKAHLHAGAKDVSLLSGERENPKLLPRMFAAIMPDSPKVKVDDPLEGEKAIDVGGEQVLAIPMPGHTPGSYAYVFRGVAFVGDAVNFRKGALTEPPRPLTEDPELARASIRALGDELKKHLVSTICTGHGGCVPIDKLYALISAMKVE